MDSVSQKEVDMALFKLRELARQPDLEPQQPTGIIYPSQTQRILKKNCTLPAQTLYERAMAEKQKKKRKILEAQEAKLLKEAEEAMTLTFRPDISKTDRTAPRNLKQFLMDQEQWNKKKAQKIEHKKAVAQIDQSRQIAKKGRQIKQLSRNDTSIISKQNPATERSFVAAKRGQTRGQAPKQGKQNEEVKPKKRRQVTPQPQTRGADVSWTREQSLRKEDSKRMKVLMNLLK